MSSDDRQDKEIGVLLGTSIYKIFIHRIAVLVKTDKRSCNPVG